ncbi:hypothetical protein DRH14_00420 [Candidatus Shapirobacteria bacterium]|nr:MAG: hypothetical protein DRH14_00420 [Candidatus Shapirobacteria bacterium]
MSGETREVGVGSGAELVKRPHRFLVDKSTGVLVDYFFAAVGGVFSKTSVEEWNKIKDRVVSSVGADKKKEKINISEAEAAHPWDTRLRRMLKWAGRTKTENLWFSSAEVRFKDEVDKDTLLAKVDILVENMNNSKEEGGRDVVSMDVLLASAIMTERERLTEAVEKVKDIFGGNVPETIDPLGDESKQVATIYEMAASDPSILLALGVDKDGLFRLRSDDLVSIVYDGRPFLVRGEVLNGGLEDVSRKMAGIRLKEPLTDKEKKETERRNRKKGNEKIKRPEDRFGLTFVVGRQSEYSGQTRRVVRKFGAGSGRVAEFVVNDKDWGPVSMVNRTFHIVEDGGHADKNMLLLCDDMVGRVFEASDTASYPAPMVSYKRGAIGGHVKENGTSVRVPEQVFDSDETRLVSDVSKFFGFSPKSLYELAIFKALRRVLVEMELEDKVPTTGMNCVGFAGARRLAEIPMLVSSGIDDIAGLMRYAKDRKEQISMVRDGGLSIYDTLTLIHNPTVEKALRQALKLFHRDDVIAMFDPAILFSWGRLPDSSKMFGGDKGIELSGFDPAVAGDRTICSVAATQHADGRIEFKFRGVRGAMEELLGISDLSEQEKVLSKIRHEFVNSVRDLVRLAVEEINRGGLLQPSKDGKLLMVNNELLNGEVDKEDVASVDNWWRRAVASESRFRELNVEWKMYEKFMAMEKEDVTISEDWNDVISTVFEVAETSLIDIPDGLEDKLKEVYKNVYLRLLFLDERRNPRERDYEMAEKFAVFMDEIGVDVAGGNREGLNFKYLFQKKRYQQVLLRAFVVTRGK